MSFEDTVPRMFQARAAAHPEVTVQAFKDASGSFVYRTYSELYGDVLDLSTALVGLGVRRGDHIGLVSDNRREWLIADLSVLSLGAADVPRGCDSMEKEIAFILSSTDCRLSFIENKNQLTKIMNSREALPLLETLVMFNEPLSDDVDLAKARGVTLLSFARVLADGTAKRSGKKTEIEAEIAQGLTDDVATVIFTSGTTGEPKGVMLTHANYTWQLERIPRILRVDAGDMWLTVLPVWHSFERIMQYIIIQGASGMAYSKPVASVMLPDIAKIRPHILPGVPRLWEALASGIFRAIRKEGGIKKALFLFFVGVGKHYCNARDRVFGRVVRFTPRVRLFDTLTGLIPWLLLVPLHALGDLLIYSKIRAKLGGRIRVGVSGGGALQKDMDSFYRAIGLNLLEGYGITETTPVLSFRDENRPRPGCVGVIFPDTECRIVDGEALDRAIEAAAGSSVIVGSTVTSAGVSIDTVRGTWRAPASLGPGKVGVIMVRGGQVMKGYWKRSDLTAKVIDADGWFNTGDLGMLSCDNEIKITGRAKDTIVLLGGENIEPAPIEAAVKGFECVDSIVVLGQDKKYLAALIVPVKDAVLAYGASHDLPTEDYPSLLEDPEIIQLFRTAIDARVNHQAGFRPFEFIFRFTLLPETFQIGRELSGKQEMMRHRINEIYKKEIAALFGD